MNAGDAEVRGTTIEAIQQAVADMFGLSIEDLRTERRSRDVAVPRQIAMYLVKLMTDASLSEIGREFGGKHHTTVMHSIAKVHELRRSDAALDHTIRKLLTSLTRHS
jgi:chromosomal replication initiator protein